MNTPAFFTGINYWASHAAIHMWSQWNAAAVKSDFEKLHDAGVTALRVFPLWPVFQPITALRTPGSVYEYRFGEMPLPDTEAGRAGVSEEACAHFDEFCDLAEQYGLKLIVGLMTGHMSFRNFYPPAFENCDLLTDPTVIKWQKRFVRYFVRRFRSRACIAAWDLGNEVVNMGKAPTADHAYLWVSAISDAIRANDPTRPIVSGLAFCPLNGDPWNYTDMAELTDVLTTHPYNIFQQNPEEPLPTMLPVAEPAFRARLYAQISGKPAFVEEFGSIGYLSCSERSEADYYRAVLWSCWSHGCPGVMWWCAFDQGGMTYAPYDWNNIGSDYGFFRADGSAKPIADENRAFAQFRAQFPFDPLPPMKTEGVCLVERDCPMETLRAADLLARRANAELTFADALQPIPDAPVYFMPSISSNQAITRRRLVELLDKVRAGAVLYLSLENALFRWIPEMCGVRFHGRAQQEGLRTVLLGEEALPVAGGYDYEPEQTDAEVLARVGNRPVFFRHAYGRGTIFLLTVPIERYVSRLSGAFRDPDAPRYEDIYRTVFAAAPTGRIADSSNRFVRLTEHPVDAAHCILVALNYSDQPQTAALALAPGWRIDEMYRGAYANGTLRLAADDAAVLRAVKE